MTVPQFIDDPDTDAHAAGARRSTPHPRGRRPIRSEAVWAIVLALPMLLVFGVFSWWPIVRSVGLSFEKTNFVTSTFVWFDNFAFVLSDPLLGTAVRNTVAYVVFSLLIGVPIPLFIATAITEFRRRARLYSVLAYLPVVIPPVASIMLWRVFFDADPTGLFNTILGWFGIPPQPWLNSTTSVIPSILLEATWAGAGTFIVIVIAALTRVRADLYEAAELDGAGIWRRVWNISLPQIRGILLVLIMLQIIGVAQIFTQPYIFTSGGPENASLSLIMLVYRYGFVNGNFGAAAALSVIIALCLAVISALYLAATRRWSNDD